VSGPVRVAVLDTGVNPVHSHVRSVARAVVFREVDGRPGAVDEDPPLDVVGHGTALAGVIRYWAPDAELWSVRVLGPDLRGSGDVLAAAIEWAIAEGAQLLNLSLGTRDPAREGVLRSCVERATERGALLIASFGKDGEGDPHAARRDLPARIEGVLSVGADEACTFAVPVVVNDDPPPLAWGCPYPRPLPGVPQERNFHGPSVATAHATGLAARILAERPGLSLAELLLTLREGP